MRACVFCGQPGGNLEHIIAQWLIARMQAERYPVVVGLRREDSLRTRRAHRLKSYATRCVCEQCNNGWMSKLEVWFQKKMGFLVEPEFPKLAKDFLRLALEENASLAKWALKTAIMMDANTMTDSVIEPSLPAGLFKGEVPNGLIVELGYLEDRNVGGIVSQGFWVRNGGRPPEWQVHKERLAFKTLIQLNHLVIRVFRAPLAKASYYGVNKRLPLRCYPERQNPDDIDFRFHDLWEFDRVLELETSAEMSAQA